MAGLRSPRALVALGLAAVLLLSAGTWQRARPAFDPEEPRRPALVRDPACVLDADDPGEVGAAMPGGLHAGACLDTETERALVELDPRLATSSEGVRVANFQHDGRFWVARIPHDLGVEAVWFQREWYAPGMAHMQTLFALDPDTPLVLFPQSRRALPEARAVARIDRVVFSAEAILRRGDRYDAVRALAPYSFGLSHRFVSPSQRAAEYSGRALDQIRLDLPPEARVAFFRAAVEASLESGLGEMFDLLRRSCGTEPLSILDRVLWRSYSEETRRRLRRSRRFNPAEIERYLRWRRIRHDPREPVHAATTGGPA